MTNSIPQIRKYMTTDVQTIGDEQPMSVAHRIMREQHIRHLPVLHRGKLVGVVNDRDLRLSESLQEVDPRKITVAEAMSRHAYVVSPEERLDEVIGVMASHEYASAIVTDRGRVVGIFTTVDACSALAELLAQRPAP